MSKYSPYAPPQSELRGLGATVAGPWRQEQLLVLRRDGELPERCIRCNAAAITRRKTSLQWHHPAWYLLLILPLIYVIVAMIVRQRQKVYVGLCQRHRLRFLGGRLFTVAGVAFWFMLSLNMGRFAVQLDENTVRLLPVAMAVLCLLWVLIARQLTHLISAKRIDQDYAWLNGCDKTFLDSLPEFPGMQK